MGMSARTATHPAHVRGGPLGRLRAYLEAVRPSTIAGAVAVAVSLIIGGAVLAVGVSHKERGERLGVATEAGHVWARADSLIQTVRVTERLLGDYAAAPTPTLEHRLQEQGERVDAEMERLVAYAKSVPLGTTVVANVSDTMDAYLSVYAARVINAPDARTRAERLEVAEVESDGVILALQDVVSVSQQRVLAGRDAITADADRTALLYIGAGVISILLMVFLVWAVMVTRPLRERTAGPADTHDVKFDSTLSNPERMVAVVSHELRGPATSVLGFVEMVLADDGGALGETQRRRLEIAQRSGARMGRILDDLRVLTQSRKAMQLVLEERPCDLHQLVCDVAESMRPEADAANVRIDVRGSLSDATVDPVRICQVVANLLQNAIKFSPPGGEVAVHVIQRDTWVHIGVADQGPGVAPDLVDDIFDPFRHGQQHHGLGLGLAVSKDLVEAHGGEIHVGGVSGGGAVFTVLLPAAGPVQLVGT